jgi:hypothetical protein
MNENISNLLVDDSVDYKEECTTLNIRNVLSRKVGHDIKTRNYTRKETIEDLAEQKRRACGKGISSEDGKRRFSINKPQAQLCLKYSSMKGLNAKNLEDKVIVLISNKSRQQYLPTFLKPDILNSIIRVKHSPNKLTIQNPFIGNDLNRDWRWL